MHSAIYRGWVRHRRHAPRRHAFRYRLFLLYLDLAELDTVFRGRWLWSTRRPALARFHRADHLGDPATPLDVAVRNLVESQTGRRPTGPIRLLTHLRYFGYCFNPVSFYYCFDADDARVESIVAEVNNTPWGERHCYVLDEARDEGSGHRKRYRVEKALHVSPFMPMDLTYDWRFGTPGKRLDVHMALDRGGRLFDAMLRLERAPLTGTELALALVRFPFMTLAVVAAIHWQALKLWLKRVPVYTHPKKPPRSAQGGAASANPA
jgi:DUF1365 family protein